jgi:hypothetical protein
MMTNFFALDIGILPFRTPDPKKLNMSGIKTDSEKINWQAHGDSNVRKILSGFSSSLELTR